MTSETYMQNHKLGDVFDQKCIVSRKADKRKVEQALFNDYNDRIWLPWKNGGKSFKINAGFFKLSDYHTSG